jgi:putative DNA primase/helicase
MLYAELLKDRFLFNNSAGEWMKWCRHFWKRDMMGSAMAAVETVVEQYLQETEQVTKEINWALKKKEMDRVSDLEELRKALYKRVSRLRTDKGRNACLKFARTIDNPIAIEGNQLDVQPWLLACKNGVIDLRLGQIRAGIQTEYLSMASPTEWQGLEQPAPLWEKTLSEIFGGDNELIDYLQRLLGYACTGITRESVLPVWFGQGRNGKTLIVETISRVLGPHAKAIQGELLLDQKYARNSSGPSPDIMGLKGLRIAFASETEEGRRFSSSKVKLLTGRDELVGRNPMDKYQTHFWPTHKLILLTNSRPQADGGDFALWERLQLIAFPLSFVDREPVRENERRADNDLGSRVINEASGILAWLVRGCLQYQRQGLEPPRSIREATIEYKKEEDILGQWLEERCQLGEKFKEEARKLHEDFCTWYETEVSKKGVPSAKRFGKLLGARFEKKKRPNQTYFGLRLRFDDVEDRI